MTAGDLVVYTPDPLAVGVMIVLSVTATNRLLCEATNWPEGEDSPPRGVFDPMDLELFDVWERVT